MLVENLFAFPTVGDKFAAIGDAVVHTSHLVGEQPRLSRTPVMADEERLSPIVTQTHMFRNLAIRKRLALLIFQECGLPIGSRVEIPPARPDSMALMAILVYEET